MVTFAREMPAFGADGERSTLKRSLRSGVIALSITLICILCKQEPKSYRFLNLLRDLYRVSAILVMNQLQNQTAPTRFPKRASNRLMMDPSDFRLTNSTSGFPE